MIAFFVVVPMTAHAACSNPAGDAGKVIYNADHNVVQFCNGTNWIGMSSGSATDNLGNHTATQILNMGSNRITNVTDPTGAQDAATKAYVDAAVATSDDNLGSGGTTTGHISINNTGPTLYLQDTDHNSGMIHMNSDHLHFLSGDGVGSGTWALNGSHWPLVMNMATDVISIGGTVHLHEGNLNMGTQAITSSAGTIRDASGGWVRTYGDTGWYNGTHDGGWYMSDGTWVRSYANRNVFTGGIMRADGGFQVDGVSAISGTGQLNADSQTVTNVATPSAANDLVNKAYVDANVTGSLPTCPVNDYLVVDNTNNFVCSSAAVYNFSGAYNGVYTNTGGAASFNFTGVNLGTAATDRVIVVVAASQFGATFVGAPTITVAGTPLTIHEFDVADPANWGTRAALGSAVIPSGTSGTVNVTWSTTASGAEIFVYSIYGASSATPTYSGIATNVFNHVNYQDIPNFQENNGGFSILGGGWEVTSQDYTLYDGAYSSTSAFSHTMVDVTNGAIYSSAYRNSSANFGPSTINVVRTGGLTRGKAYVWGHWAP